LLHIATSEEIKKGKVTDVYFLRGKKVLEHLGVRKRVVAEVTTNKLPDDYQWAVLAGVEELVELLNGINISVRTMPEGSIFGPSHPVAIFEGDYLEFGTYETSILGLLCQASGIATKAARCRVAAGEKALFSFGARRMHPSIAPMIERSAFLGGFDGVAAVKSAEILGLEPVGTIPHALILLVGDTVDATRAFDEIVPPEIKRVSLIDTFQDEKFEALRVAEVLGDRLYAVRLDTPGSRKGDFRAIIHEVRWELDIRGFGAIRLLVSGGIDEAEILALNDIVDGYGVGTSISNAPVIDFSLDIVEIDGEPVSKRGKLSGSKDALRCGQCGQVFVYARGRLPPPETCSCGSELHSALEDVIKGGRVMVDPSPPVTIRERVITQLKSMKLQLL
jgi:nicotinate phosphoribosyltransferase